MSRRTLPIQRRLQRLQQRIAAEARDSQARVDQLTPRLVEDVNLEAAWDRVRRSAGARTPGVDGLTRRQLEGRSRRWLDALRRQLMTGNYAPDEVRWVQVPRGNGDRPPRLLGILTLRDRVAHAAIGQVLEPVFEPRFAGDSFGFRPGRSVAMAVTEVCETLSADADLNWAVRLDVADCFGTVRHDRVRAAVTARVCDEPLLANLDRLLTGAGNASSGPAGWWSRRRGLIQGSPLSPLLCNIVLDAVDQGFARSPDHAGGRARLFRYADDLLLVTDGRVTGRRCVRRVRRLLRAAGQRFAGDKTGRGPVERGVEWLGLRIVPRDRLNRLTGRREFGFTVPDRVVRRVIERIDRQTSGPVSRIDREGFEPAVWINRVNRLIRQWAQVYRYADDAPAVFAFVDEYTRARVHAVLRSMTGLGDHELRQNHRVCIARGYWTWQVAGTRLVQLAPARPRRLSPTGEPAARDCS